VIDVGDEMTRRRVLAAHADVWMSTYEGWLAAHVDSGRHAQVIGPLSMLADQRPLSEAVQGLLMLALHHTGRRNEALEVYLRTRRLLVAELGVEPGQGLREAHRLVLQGTPDHPGHPVPGLHGSGPQGWAGSLWPETMVSDPAWGGPDADHLVHS
jgi:hypothetical protein